MSSSKRSASASVAGSRRRAIEPRTAKNADLCRPPSKYKSSPSSSRDATNFSAHDARTIDARREDHEEEPIEEEPIASSGDFATARACTAASVAVASPPPAARRRAGETRDASAASSTFFVSPGPPEKGIGIPALVPGVFVFASASARTTAHPRRSVNNAVADSSSGHATEVCGTERSETFFPAVRLASSSSSSSSSSRHHASSAPASSGRRTGTPLPLSCAAFSSSRASSALSSPLVTFAVFVRRDPA